MAGPWGKGVVDFVIKVYFPNERFPEGGKVSQHMHALKVGRCKLRYRSGNSTACI